MPEDERGLQRALELAREAAAFASPNPTVGCVLFREGVTLGEGAHYYDHFDHAEIAALKQAAANGCDVRGATACVTLEPCSHHGRTGPCADALAAAGIARCVAATVDPNPQVRGQGIAKLRAAGVEVLVAEASSEIAQQARRLNDAFAFSIQHGRPFVTLKAAVSRDGYLAPASSARTRNAPYWLTGEAARADVQTLRHSSDAILTGVGTVLADDPMLTDRSGAARRRPLQRIILDSHLRTPLDSQLVRSAAGDLLIFCLETAPTPAIDNLRERGVEVIAVPGQPGKLDLPAIFKALEGRGLRSLLIEAGTAINGRFYREDLVDRVVLYYSETTLGDDAFAFAEGVPSPDTVRSVVTGVEEVSFPNRDGHDLRVSGYLHEPWEGV